MNNTLINEAAEAWLAYSGFRTRRQRFKNFTYGDQWSDTVIHDGRTMTRAQQARALNRRPMTNNLMRRMVKSVVGRYRYQRQEQTPATPLLSAVSKTNNLELLDCRAFEEFLISGSAIQRVALETTIRGTGTWVENVPPDNFFSSLVTDPRGWDVDMIGMFHDWTLPDALARLAGTDPVMTESIKHLLTQERTDTSFLPVASGHSDTSRFFSPPAGRHRVIEIWKLSTTARLNCHDTAHATIFTLPASSHQRLEAINRARLKRNIPPIEYRLHTDTHWEGTFLTTSGHILKSTTAPSHPFLFMFYPLIDGEVHPLVEDVIDQQIQINELISLNDHVLSCSAKGLLIFPQECMVPTLTYDDVTRIWSAPDGMLPVRETPTGKYPFQLQSNNNNAAATELLRTQMQMFEDISGVSNILMGRNTSSNMGLEQYESQVKNALISIADILETFNSFIDTRNSRISSLLPVPAPQ